MRQVDLTAVDLNLLKLFDALVRERSVTRAGLHLGLSQPATSRALGRLRTMLGDRLVVRGKLGLELTPRGEALAGPVSRLLDDARGIVAPAAFDPRPRDGADHDRRARSPEPGGRCPASSSASSAMRPRSASTSRRPSATTWGSVETGIADLALGMFEMAPGSLHRRTLYTDASCAW